MNFRYWSNADGFGNACFALEEFGDGRLPSFPSIEALVQIVTILLQCLRSQMVNDFALRCKGEQITLVERVSGYGDLRQRALGIDLRLGTRNLQSPLSGRDSNFLLFHRTSIYNQ